MRKWVFNAFITSLIFVTAQFKNSQKTVSANYVISNNSISKTSLSKQDTVPSSKLTWVDSSIIDYIKNSNDELLKLNRNSHIPEQWMLDTRYWRGKKYIVAEIGHDNKYRFVPDSWVYLDSLSRKIFVYDTINDTLIKWER